MYKILLAEDDIWYSQYLEHYLQLNPDYEIVKCDSGKSFKQKVNGSFHTICLDINLPDVSGRELLKHLKVNYPDIPVIVISGQEEVAVAVEMLKHDNVWDYIVKDEETNERLWKSLIKLQERSKLKSKVSELEEKLVDKFEFQKVMKGNSEALNSIFHLMKKAANSNINVSITGETGTGKELVASAIHYNSNRKNKNFVAVNMSAIPRELAESELFGHEKGAFTGAVGARTGKFEDANKGTIFLDEIADVPSDLQAKLLRVLQEREIVKVGGNKVVKIDCRIIVATHKDLAEEVKKGNFREDLFYRIAGLPISLPPLRNRKEDILILAKHFVDAYCKSNKVKGVSFSSDAKEKIKQHHYPGNIRELKSAIELAAVMCDDSVIEAHDVTFNNPLSISDLLSEEKTLKEYTNHIISVYLSKYDGDVALVAKKLAIGKSTLYKMIQSEDLSR